MGITYDLFKDMVSARTFKDDSFLTLELREKLVGLKAEKLECEGWIGKKDGYVVTENYRKLESEMTDKLKKESVKSFRTFMWILAAFYYLFTFGLIYIFWSTEYVGYYYPMMLVLNVVAIILLHIGFIKGKDRLIGCGGIILILFLVLCFGILPGFFAWLPLIIFAAAVIIGFVGMAINENQYTFEKYKKSPEGIYEIKVAQELDENATEQKIAECRERLSVISDEIKRAEEEFEGYKVIYEIWESQDRMIRLHNVPLLPNSTEAIKQMICQLPYSDVAVIPIQAAEQAMEKLKVSKIECEQTIDDIMGLWNDLTK